MPEEVEEIRKALAIKKMQERASQTATCRVRSGRRSLRESSGGVRSLPSRFVRCFDLKLQRPLVTLRPPS